MDIDQMAEQFIAYLQSLPQEQLYNYTHNNDRKITNAFLKTQNLTFSEFRTLHDAFDWVMHEYAGMRIELPPLKKKPIVRKKKAVMDDTD